MSPEQFPLLQAAARSGPWFVKAVQQISDGLALSSIRNAVLKDAKQTLSSAVSRGWIKYVQEPFFHRGAYEAYGADVVDLDIMMSGLHDVLAASRKLAKTKATGDVVNAMRAFVAEALPLAEAVASLKDKVTKGRAPSTPKPVNPNKVIKTCPCCFRAIAVLRSHMAHHGYERPRIGWQTGSCPGIRFQPLEVSNEGLICLVDTLRSRLAHTEHQLGESGKLTSLKAPARGEKLADVVKGAPAWEQEFAKYVRRLEGEIRRLRQEVVRLEARLREWKPQGGATTSRHGNASLHRGEGNA